MAVLLHPAAEETAKGQVGMMKQRTWGNNVPWSARPMPADSLDRQDLWPDRPSVREHLREKLTAYLQRIPLRFAQATRIGQLTQAF